MATHVAATARAAHGIDEVRFLVLASDGLPADVSLLHEPGEGLNAALAAAVTQADLAAAARVVFLAGDLPLLTPGDVALLTVAAGETVVIAPDRHGIGTNAISLPLAHAADFRFAFGSDSLARHRAEVARVGLDLIEVHSEGLARDVDLPDELVDAARFT